MRITGKKCVFSTGKKLYSLIQYLKEQKIEVRYVLIITICMNYVLGNILVWGNLQEKLSVTFKIKIGKLLYSVAPYLNMQYGTWELLKTGFIITVFTVLTFEVKYFEGLR